MCWPFCCCAAGLAPFGDCRHGGVPAPPPGEKLLESFRPCHPVQRGAVPGVLGHLLEPGRLPGPVCGLYGAGNRLWLLGQAVLLALPVAGDCVHGALLLGGGADHPADLGEEPLPGAERPAGDGELPLFGGAPAGGGGCAPRVLPPAGGVGGHAPRGGFGGPAGKPGPVENTEQPDRTSLHRQLRGELHFAGHRQQGQGSGHRLYGGGANPGEAASLPL